MSELVRPATSADHLEDGKPAVLQGVPARGGRATSDSLAPQLSIGGRHPPGARSRCRRRRPVSTPGVNAWMRAGCQRLCARFERVQFRGNGGGHSLGGREIGDGTGWAGDGDGDVALQRAVSCRVIGSAVLPALPDDATPSTPESPDSARVFKAALARLAVERLGPGMPVAGAVSEPGERDTQSLVAAPAELGGLAFAGSFATADWPASAASASRLG